MLANSIAPFPPPVNHKELCKIADPLKGILSIPTHADFRLYPSSLYPFQSDPKGSLAAPYKG